jgi:hypothetical protein
MDYMTERHALKFAAIGVAQQQRILKKLAKSARERNTRNLGNAESEEANCFDWHRNVRLKREARALNLYRGWLKGLAYNQVEQSTRRETLVTSRLPFNFVPYTLMDDFFDWLYLGNPEGY